MPFLPRLFLLLLLASPAAAQSVEFSKDNFGANKDGLREAQRELKAGDQEYFADPARYVQALPHLLAAQELNPNNAALNVKIGDCYLHSATKTAALPYLQKAARLDATADARTHYLLARALHLSARWREAMAEYQLAPPLPAADRRSEPPYTAAEIQRHLQECRTGQQLMAHPVRVFIDNAGPELNSAGSDYGPVASARKTSTASPFWGRKSRPCSAKKTSCWPRGSRPSSKRCCPQRWPWPRRRSRF